MCRVLRSVAGQQRELEGPLLYLCPPIAEVVWAHGAQNIRHEQPGENEHLTKNSSSACACERCAVKQGEVGHPKNPTGGRR